MGVFNHQSAVKQLESGIIVTFFSWQWQFKAKAANKKDRSQIPAILSPSLYQRLLLRIQLFIVLHVGLLAYGEIITPFEIKRTDNKDREFDQNLSLAKWGLTPPFKGHILNLNLKGERPIPSPLELAS